MCGCCDKSCGCGCGSNSCKEEKTTSSCGSSCGSKESFGCKGKCCGCCSCGCKGTCSKSGCGSHQGYAEQLLELADCAWMELLKEKIKEEIKKQASDHLNQLAQLVSSANHQRWKSKMCEKCCCEDFKQQLKGFMKSSSEGKK